MKKALLIIFTAFILYSNLQNVSAEVCIVDNLNISSASGTVFFTNGTLINDLPIKLAKDEAGEKIIKEIKSDESGRFDFGRLKSGKYYLIIEDYLDLAPLTFLVKLKKKYGKKGDVGIKIVMKSIFDCSYAETKVLNKTEETTKAAKVQ